MKNSIFILCFLLVSCANIQEKPKETVKVNIPNDLLVECQTNEKLTGSTMGELLVHDINTMIKLSECSKRFKRLKEAVSSENK